MLKQYKYILLLNLQKILKININISFLNIIIKY